MILTIAITAYITLAVCFIVCNRRFVRLGSALGAPRWASVLSLVLCSLVWPVCWGRLIWGKFAPAQEGV